MGSTSPSLSSSTRIFLTVVFPLPRLVPLPRTGAGTDLARTGADPAAPAAFFFNGVTVTVKYPYGYQQTTEVKTYDALGLFHEWNFQFFCGTDLNL